MIRLRALEREDLKQSRDWRNDPDIFSRVREYRFLNMENQEAWFDSLRDDRKTIMFGIEWTYERPIDPQLIGVCGITNIDWVGKKAEVSIYIGSEEYRKKGLGVEILNALAKYAFEECNLQKLWAEVFSNNPIGIKLFEKAKYTLEGKLSLHAYKNGAYLDSWIFGLLRNEWQKNYASK